MSPPTPIRSATEGSLPFRHIRFLSGWLSRVENAFCGLHDHPGVEIVYHPSGRGWTEMGDGTRLSFEPGTTVVYPPRTAHSQTMLESGSDLVIQMLVEPLPERLREPLVIGRSPAEATLTLMQTLAHPPAGRTPLQQSSFDLRAGALLCELLELPSQSAAEVGADREGGGAPGEGKGEGHAEQALRLIREEYRELPSVAELAPRLGIGYDHLRHLFTQRYGFSLQAWLIKTRLERAKELLQYSNLPLKAIASLCGFGTDRHLCSAFRKETGMTPGNYRQRKENGGKPKA